MRNSVEPIATVKPGNVSRRVGIFYRSQRLKGPHKNGRSAEDPCEKAEVTAAIATFDPHPLRGFDSRSLREQNASDDRIRLRVKVSWPASPLRTQEGWFAVDS